ncbi:MAG TPA: isochorismatase family cysteine hydrolase, partial [Micromonosporaceae bacterium]
MNPPVEFADRSGFRAEMNALLRMDPASTVVCTVDMQRDYLDPEIATAPVAAGAAAAVVAATAQFLDAARGLKIPVVHIYVKRRVIEHEYGFTGSAYSSVGRRANLSQNANAPARSGWDRVEDSPQSDVPDALQEPGDVHVTTKKTMDSFYGTDLDMLLTRALRPTSLVIAGINTDTCVYSTAFAAANRGYQVVVPSDCTASMRGADHHWMALELMSRS